MVAKDPGGLITTIYTDAGLQQEDQGKRSNRRGHQMRERLVAAGTECFSEYGYSRTRISDVVHRAGTSQGNFYRHFTSLDDLFLTVIRPGLEDLASASSRKDADGARDSASVDALIATNTAYLHTYARHRHILRLLREAAAASANDGFQSLWLRMRGDFVERTRRWLERTLGPGEAADPDHALLAEVLGCLTEQLAYIHVGLAPTTPRPERINELGRALGVSWHRLLPAATN